MKLFDKPQVGKVVRVVVGGDYTHYRIPEHLQGGVHEGTVVPDIFKGKDAFAMTSGLPSYYRFPIRTIQLKDVLELTYLDGSEATSKEVADTTGVITKIVTGSKGDEYLVQRIGGTWTCNCVAGKYHRMCKHVRQVQEEIT